MSDFRDPELERLLGGTRDVDVDVAYDRVLGRVRTAKRRRAAVVGGTACALLLAVGALAAGRGDDAGSIRPGGDGSRLQPDDTVGTDGTVTIDSAVTTLPSPSGTALTGTTVPRTTVTGTTVPGATPPTNPTTGGTTPSGATASAPTVAAPTTVASTSPGAAPTSTAPTAAAPPASTAAPVTTTFSGIGGSVTVRSQDGTLTMVSAQAADGFGTEVRQASGDRVEVRFESATHRTDARVDLVNGSMVPRIDESAR